ncbi:MAG: CRISPR-associated endonuclease Cas2 [Desulfatirhabdiaceae bacterium]
MKSEHLYIVSYDIRNDKRWKRIYKTLKGYGAWLQLSVFQCRLEKMSMIRLEAELSDLLNHDEDHLLIMDIGPAENIKPKIKSYGKPFEPVTREAIIV